MTVSEQLSTLMVVDDDEVDQMIYERIASSSGISKTFVAFTNPQEAIEFLSDSIEALPELIILDIRMPEMSGFEFLDRIAQDMEQIYEKLNVVMVSTSNDPKDLAASKRHSVVKDYLNKPISTDELRELVDLMRRDEKQEQS